MGFTEHSADKDVKGCYGEPISISNQTFLMCVHSDTAMFSSLIPLKPGNLMERCHSMARLRFFWPANSTFSNPSIQTMALSLVCPLKFLQR